MCVVSMIMEHYGDKWGGLPQSWPQQTGTIIIQPPAISPEEIAEFRKLLERAREYDKRNNEPDCELESKRDVIRKIAEKLGVDVSFL